MDWANDHSSDERMQLRFYAETNELEVIANNDRIPFLGKNEKASVLEYLRLQTGLLVREELMQPSSDRQLCVYTHPGGTLKEQLKYFEISILKHCSCVQFHPNTGDIWITVVGRTPIVGPTRSRRVTSPIADEKQGDLQPLVINLTKEMRAAVGDAIKKRLGRNFDCNYKGVNAFYVRFLFFAEMESPAPLVRRFILNVKRRTGSASSTSDPPETSFFVPSGPTAAPFDPSPLPSLPMPTGPAVPHTSSFASSLAPPAYLPSHGYTRGAAAEASFGPHAPSAHSSSASRMTRSMMMLTSPTALTSAAPPMELPPGPLLPSPDDFAAVLNVPLPRSPHQLHATSWGGTLTAYDPRSASISASLVPTQAQDPWPQLRHSLQPHHSPSSVQWDHQTHSSNMLSTSAMPWRAGPSLPATAAFSDDSSFETRSPAPSPSQYAVRGRAVTATTSHVVQYAAIRSRSASANEPRAFSAGASVRIPSGVQAHRTSGPLVWEEPIQKSAGHLMSTSLHVCSPEETLFNATMSSAVGLDGGRSSETPQHSDFPGRRDNESNAFALSGRLTPLPDLDHIPNGLDGSFMDSSWTASDSVMMTDLASEHDSTRLLGDSLQPTVLPNADHQGGSEVGGAAIEEDRAAAVGEPPFFATGSGRGRQHQEWHWPWK